jgi:hypothetical protein
MDRMEAREWDRFQAKKGGSCGSGEEIGKKGELVLTDAAMVAVGNPGYLAVATRGEWLPKGAADVQTLVGSARQADENKQQRPV